MDFDSIAQAIGRQFVTAWNAPIPFIAALIAITYVLSRLIKHEFATRLANSESTAAMYKERLARFEVEETMSIATASHERVAKADREVGAVSPVKKSETNAAQTRVYVRDEHDAAHFMGMFEGRTQLQAQRMLKDEVGKWMGARGIVINVQDLSSEVLIALNLGNLRMVFAYFPGDTPGMDVIAVGDVVAVEGRIETVEPLGITLVKCELTEHSPRPASA